MTPEREGDRVWLDLDELYPEPLRQPNTVFKSMAITFRAMGAEVDYVDLMGVSAAAFRIQVGGRLCPSSPHPHLGFACDDLMLEALGVGFRSSAWDPARPETLDVARKVVVESVDRGGPVLTDDEEAGLAVGYERGGEEILIRDPYSKKGDPPEVLGPKWPGWGVTVITRPPTPPTRDDFVRSLEVGVELAHRKRSGSYASGFAAYEAWATQLRDETLLGPGETDADAVVTGNANIYYCLEDARRCVVGYLSRIRGALPEAATPFLDRAAAHYEAVAEVLGSGWDHVPWPHQLETPTNWTLEQRRRQAAILEMAAEKESGAVAELETALRVV